LAHTEQRVSVREMGTHRMNALLWRETRNASSGAISRRFHAPKEGVIEKTSPFRI
jgi:hypothetical protein